MDKVERVLFKALEDHARRINRSFKELGLAINAWIEGNLDEVNKKIAIIRELESDASKLKKTLLKEVAGAEANIHRTDYIRLILQLDEAAGYQGGAAVRLGRTDFHPALTDPIAEKFKRLTEVFSKMGDALAAAVRWVDENQQKAEEYCDQIDAIEEQVDSVYRDLEVHLFSRKDLDIRIIFMIRSVALHIEEACDITDRVSDSLRIILMA